MIPVPFVFWRYGAKIRSKSRTIRQLREQQDAMEAKRAEDQAKRDGYSSSDGQLALDDERSIFRTKPQARVMEVEKGRR
ncbi:hypothetical protein NLG97_g9331 [Lecanicillium saksenae]|uniref:Uncharacterized protein n=1 Tax=Lecanicillium saksenae TaxID=468837 RepID=A0ACC1QHS8_9HYPO|nr:hypothetical protein NLG97_g9331 [Lecanicillium saksenae]